MKTLKVNLNKVNEIVVNHFANSFCFSSENTDSWQKFSEKGIAHPANGAHIGSSLWVFSVHLQR